MLINNGVTWLRGVISILAEFLDPGKRICRPQGDAGVLHQQYYGFSASQISTHGRSLS